MPEPELNLDSILGREKKPELSQLDPDFYDRAAGLLRELEAEKKNAEPGSTEDNHITDQLETAKGQAIEIIHERMGKIIRVAASRSAQSKKGDAPPLTQEELKLYNVLLNLITEYRRDSLGRVFGRVPDKKCVPLERKTGDVPGYILVRMLTNVPTFVGIDNRNYTLAKGDIVMVPGINAKALITRKAAAQIVMK